MQDVERYLEQLNWTQFGAVDLGEWKGLSEAPRVAGGAH